VLLQLPLCCWWRSRLLQAAKAEVGVMSLRQY
jgi:hypothetical protein